MPNFSSSNVIYFMAFVVPGFISMQIYGQIQPLQKKSLKDNLLEAISFGTINFVLLLFPILWLVAPGSFNEHPVGVWVATIATFLVCPLLWPWLLLAALRFLAKWNLILDLSPTAWDHYFRQSAPCWVLVHISETERIGGRFGRNSYASAYPDPGHIYIEQLWELNDQGKFVSQKLQSHGIVLRPGDYKMVEFFNDER